jgi:hypothetical protein
VVLNCFGQHAGKLSEIVHNFLVKIPSVRLFDPVLRRYCGGAGA